MYLGVPHKNPFKDSKENAFRQMEDEIVNAYDQQEREKGGKVEMQLIKLNESVMSEQQVVREATHRDKPVAAGFSRQMSDDQLMRQLTRNVAICLKSIAATKELIEQYRAVFD